MSEKITARLLVTVQFTALGLLGFLAAYGITSSKQKYLILNVCSIGLGLSAIVIAAISLKPSLKISPIPKPGAPFIQTGIYQFVRHPMYLGVILIGFGLAGIANTSFALLIELILTATLIFKSRFEDRLLAEIHPEILEYQRRVSPLFPCLGNRCKTNF